MTAPLHAFIHIQYMIAFRMHTVLNTSWAQKVECYTYYTCSFMLTS